MPDKLNQHFVPKYVFRQFNGGERRINLVSKASSAVVCGASIRHQCARNKYYGTPNIEDQLQRFDSEHSSAFRAVVRESVAPTPVGLSNQERYLLAEALSLQHSRVPRKCDDTEHSMRQFRLFAIQQFMESLPCSPFGPDTQGVPVRCEVETQGDPLRDRLLAMKSGVESAKKLLDLKTVVLRNQTNTPFVFGDSPCLFYNRHLYDVKNFAVLDHESPGLIVFMPVNQQTYTMFYDFETYELSTGGTVSEICEEGDVIQLNSLQVHAAKESIYFSNPEYADTLADVVTSLRPSFKNVFSKVMKYAPGSLIIGGHKVDRQVIHTFETHLPLRLDLSFVQTKPANVDETVFPSALPDLRRKAHEIQSLQPGRIVVGPSFTAKFQKITPLRETGDGNGDTAH